MLLFLPGSRLKHQLLIVRFVPLHVADLLFEILDELQVIGRDVVVILPNVLPSGEGTRCVICGGRCPIVHCH